MPTPEPRSQSKRRPDDLDFSSLLIPTERSRSTDAVVSQLSALLVSGQVSTGTRLPSERALATMLSVSRTTVREALRILEGKGFLEIRLGGSGGAFFRGPDPATMGAALSMLLLFESATERDLYEYRCDFERENAAIAAERATESERAHLQALLDDARAFDVETAWDEIRNLDLEIHVLLPRLTHNSVRLAIANGIYDALKRTFDTAGPLGERPHILRHEVVEILEPIIRGRPEDAARAMDEHLQRWQAAR